jgi:hypothetical protein
MYLNPDLAAKYCFNDLPESEGRKLAALMPGHSALTFAGKLTYPAYHHVPATYILCQKDDIIPPEVQRRFIETMKEKNDHVDVVEVDSGHCPNNSRTGFVVEVVNKAVGGKRTVSK